MKLYFHKSISVMVIKAFVVGSLYVPQAMAGEVVVPIMPAPGSMVALSPAFIPAHLKGITVNPNDPLKFDFLVHKGDGNLDLSQKNEEYTKLVKYFLAALAVPDQDQWVNLSPYEKNRIIDENFGKTEMGRDLLSQDYLLKQITSSLMYPESGLGKSFWDKVYERAQKEFGTTNIPVNTFNKVWITPSEVVIYEAENSAYVLKTQLKVMLEEDYLATVKNQGQPGESSKKAIAPQSDKLTQNVIKQIILPELEKEVNEGKNFAMLRQIVNSMALAAWFKQSLKESLLAQVYANKAKVEGINLTDPKKAQAELYQQYLTAFKKGVYNYVKDVPATGTGKESLPRKYFAGGFAPNSQAMIVRGNADPALVVSLYNAFLAGLDRVATVFTPQNWIRRGLAAFLSGTIALTAVLPANQAFAQAPRTPGAVSGATLNLPTQYTINGKTYFGIVEKQEGFVDAQGKPGIQVTYRRTDASGNVIKGAPTDTLFIPSGSATSTQITASLPAVNVPMPQRPAPGGVEEKNVGNLTIKIIGGKITGVRDQEGKTVLIGDFVTYPKPDGRGTFHGPVTQITKPFNSDVITVTVRRWRGDKTGEVKVGPDGKLTTGPGSTFDDPINLNNQPVSSVFTKVLGENDSGYPFILKETGVARVSYPQITEINSKPVVERASDGSIRFIRFQPGRVNEATLRRFQVDGNDILGVLDKLRSSGWIDGTGKLKVVLDKESDTRLSNLFSGNLFYLVRAAIASTRSGLEVGSVLYYYPKGVGTMTGPMPVDVKEIIDNRDGSFIVVFRRFQGGGSEYRVKFIPAVTTLNDTEFSIFWHNNGSTAPWREMYLGQRSADGSKNPAMFIQANDNVGGIDLNSSNYNLLIKRDGTGKPLAFNQQDMAQLGNIDGFLPKVQSILPAVMPGFLSQLNLSNSANTSLARNR